MKYQTKKQQAEKVISINRDIAISTICAEYWYKRKRWENEFIITYPRRRSENKMYLKGFIIWMQMMKDNYENRFKSKQK